VGVKAFLLTAIMIAALILGALAAALFGARTHPRFTLLGGNDGSTVWRLDTRTGRVSVCGSALTGPSLAQAESQLTAHIRAAGTNPAALAALGPEIDDLDGLSRPRCSPWSAP
jgi:hypothetical protein